MSPINKFISKKVINNIPNKQFFHIRKLNSPQKK